MEQSILKTVKKLAGVGDDDTSFDLDLITHINTAFSHLHQLGVGSDPGYMIEDDASTWEDAFPNMPLELLSAVKNNIQLRVRQLFDPPQQWHLMNSLNQLVLESDVRVSIIRESTDWVDPRPPTRTYLDDEEFPGVELIEEEEVALIDGGDPTDD